MIYLNYCGKETTKLNFFRASESHTVLIVSVTEKALKINKKRKCYSRLRLDVISSLLFANNKVPDVLEFHRAGK